MLPVKRVDLGLLWVLWEKLQLLRPVLVVKTSQEGSQQPVKGLVLAIYPTLGHFGGFSQVCRDISQ